MLTLFFCQTATTSVTSNQSTELSTSPAQLCRDPDGLWPRQRFIEHSCSMCYSFIYPNRLDASGRQYDVPNISEPQNETWMRTVCADVALTGKDCDRWRDCCLAAERCCDRQLHNQAVAMEISGYCPRTWDGYDCWDDTPAGTIVYSSCPAFIPYASTTGKYSVDQETGFLGKSLILNSEKRISANGNARCGSFHFFLRFLEYYTFPRIPIDCVNCFSVIPVSLRSHTEI